MLGKLIYTRREALGLKQAALAQRVGVTQSYISRLERGNRVNISIDVLVALAQHLGLAEVDLLAAANADGIGGLPGTDDLVAPLQAVIGRVGQFLTRRDVDFVATQLERMADERAAMRAELEVAQAAAQTAHGYHVTQSDGSDDDHSNERTA